MYDAFILLKDKIGINEDITAFNGSIITRDYLIWCYNKHGKYDRFKNNIEKLLRYNRMISFKILEEYYFKVLFGKIDDKFEEYIIDLDTKYCDDCQTKFIVIFTWNLSVNITCIHSLEEIITC